MSNFVGLHSVALKKGDSEPAAPVPGNPRVYSMRFCPFSRRVTIYLAKKQVPVEVVNINLAQKPDWYFDKHPSGQTPVFELDGKLVIESGLIPEYLDDIYPENRILPSDPYRKYKKRLTADKLSCVSTGMFSLFDKIKSKNFDKTPEAAIKGVETAEKVLEGQFFSGNLPGCVDYLVYPILELYWVISNIYSTKFDKDNFPGEKEYPKLTQWFKEIQKLPEIITSTNSLENHKKYIIATYVQPDDSKTTCDIGL